jgi:hypothetical protein
LRKTSKMGSSAARSSSCSASTGRDVVYLAPSSPLLTFPFPVRKSLPSAPSTRRQAPTERLPKRLPPVSLGSHREWRPDGARRCQLRTTTSSSAPATSSSGRATGGACDLPMDGRGETAGRPAERTGQTMSFHRQTLLIIKRIAGPAVGYHDDRGAWSPIVSAKSLQQKCLRDRCGPRSSSLAKSPAIRLAQEGTFA